MPSNSPGGSTLQWGAMRHLLCLASFALAVSASSGEARRNNGSDRHDVAQFPIHREEYLLVVCHGGVYSERSADHDGTVDWRRRRRRQRRTTVDDRLGGHYHGVVCRRLPARAAGGRRRCSLRPSRQVLPLNRPRRQNLVATLHNQLKSFRRAQLC